MFFKDKDILRAWMELENIMLSEISQSEKDTSILFHSYVESNEQTELTSKVETDSDREQADSSGGWGLGSAGVEPKGKRAHGHGPQCGD